MSRDRYQLGPQLGSGHFTAGVYRATHADLGRDVAIKLLSLRNPEHRSALLAEGRRMAEIPQNDHIVQVLDSGDWDEDHVYLAVELCEEGSLEDLCADGPADAQTACRLISDACRGLHTLHSEQMLHLDVRPANILLSHGQSKISDFGLARARSDAQLGTFYGQHAAPELILTHAGSVRTDLYAMAMTLAHVLSAGEVCAKPIPTPVDARSWREYPDHSTLGPQVPERLRRLIKRATAFEPSDRHTDVEAFKRDLDRATPAIAFVASGTTRLVSTDETVTIDLVPVNSQFRIDVRVNGRKRTALCSPPSERRTAERALRGLVSSFAYPA